MQTIWQSWDGRFMSQRFILLVLSLEAFIQVTVNVGWFSDAWWSPNLKLSNAFPWVLQSPLGQFYVSVEKKKVYSLPLDFYFWFVCFGETQNKLCSELTPAWCYTISLAPIACLLLYCLPPKSLFCQKDKMKIYFKNIEAFIVRK